MITGNDEISNKALDLLRKGTTLQNLVRDLNITLDQGKKLSRFFSMQKALDGIPLAHQEKFKALGLKSLVLAPLFKEGDLEGLQEILESIDTNIKRTELEKMPLAVIEKRKHIDKIKKQLNIEFEELDLKESLIEKKLQELMGNQERLDQSLSFLQWASKEAKEFLMEHLGFCKGRIVFYKRVDISWHNSLKEAGVIGYDEENSVWVIKDIQALITETEKRLSDKALIYYDYTKNGGIFDNSYPLEPEYGNVQGLNLSMAAIVKKNEEELLELEEERRKLKKLIAEIKSKSPQNFMQAAILSNEMSKKDLETHAALQNSAMRWLYNNGCICGSEILVDNHRFDVVGYDEKGCVTIFEAKASIKNFKGDNKWKSYLKYCNKFYFIFNDLTYNFNMDIILSTAETEGVGIIIVTKGAAEVVLESKIRESVQGTETVIYSVGRVCSRKLIYGY